MQTIRSFATAILFLLSGYIGLAQQLRLGKNPFTVEKSAVLELQSDNQGLLLSRITDTTSINFLSPPDGMMIYFAPTKRVLVRTNGYWQSLPTIIDTSSISNFYQKTRSLFSGTAPVTFNNATGQIGITQASASTNGYLSSTDWNTFNNKAASFATGNLTETGSGILTIAGGTNAVVGSGTSIQVKQATTSQNGFLSSTDWNTFNSKLSTIDTSNISNFYLKVRGEYTAGTGIGYSNTTGVISNTGVLSVNGNTGALTMDTGYISNFSVKTRGLFSGTAPVTFNSATGAIGITQASASTNGYLSSTDWNTFNNKAASFTTGNLTETGSGILTITGGTGAVAGSGTSIQVKQATTSQNGFLSSADWNTFNSKLSSIDTTNISNFYLKVRGEHTAGTGIGYSNTSGVISNTGVLSVNGNTGALTMDTGYINNFSVKTRSLFNAGAGITYNAATGAISSSVSTANLWAFGGNTVGAIKNIGTVDNYDFPFITNNTERMRLSNAGNLGLGTSSFDASNPEKLLVNAGTTSSVNAIAGKGNINNYLQLNIQNQSAGTSASSDVVATADNGSETTNYIDMGINSSANTSGAMGGANDSYLYNIGQNLLIGTGSASKSLVFMTGGTTQSANERMRIDGSGNVGIGTNAPTNALHVVGTNPLKLSGIQSGAGTDSLLTLDATGIVRKRKLADVLSNTAISSLNGLTGSTQTFATGTSGTAPGWSSATSIHTLNIPLAATGGVTAGLLSNTDWNTFNNKLSAIDTGNISNFYLKVRGEHTAGTGIGYSNTTGVISNTGVLSVNGNTGTLTMDTGYISNFYIKSRSLLNAGTGITYNPATGTISSTVSTANSWALNGNTVGAIKTIGTIDNYDFPFITNNTERMRISNTGDVGIGVTNPTNPLVVKDTLEIRRTGTMSSLLFSNTAGSGDFRIGGDGSDLFWQGGGGRNLQMGAYWGIVLAGDRQSSSFPAFSNGVANTNVLIQAQRDASIPLAIQANSATQSANLTEWRSSASNILGVVDESGKFGIGSSNPQAKLHVEGTNPLSLYGVQTGTNTSTDSVLTIASGVVKKLPASTFSAASNSWNLGGNTVSTIKNFGTVDNSHLPFITNNTERMRLSNTGNLGIGTSTFNSTYPEKLVVDAGTTSSVNAIVGKGSINSYLQLNIQNQSAGTNASSDVVATADNGDETTNYVDMGINSSTNNSGIMGGVNDSYLYNIGQNFLIGTGSASKSLVFMTGGTTQSSNERMRIDGNGKVGIGTTSPTAALHLRAGTATASTGAPLKFTSGTNLTTAEDGAVEYDGTNYFATSGTTRYTLAKTLTATASLDFPNVTGINASTLTITVTGAADGDVVSLGVPNALASVNGVIYSAYVSSANTVTVKFSNNNALTSINPAAATFRVTVIKY